MAVHRPRILQASILGLTGKAADVPYKDGWWLNTSTNPDSYAPTVVATPRTYKKGDWAYDALDGGDTTGFIISMDFAT